MTNPFTSLFAYLAGFSHSMIAYLETTVLPVLKTDAGNLLAQLAPIALDVVMSIEADKTLTNSKRDAAYAQVKDAAIAAGINATTQLLNKSIEDAVAAMHAKA